MIRRNSAASSSNHCSQSAFSEQVYPASGRHRVRTISSSSSDGRFRESRAAKETVLRETSPVYAVPASRSSRRKFSSASVSTTLVNSGSRHIFPSPNSPAMPARQILLSVPETRPRYQRPPPVLAYDEQPSAAAAVLVPPMSQDSVSPVNKYGQAVGTPVQQVRGLVPHTGGVIHCFEQASPAWLSPKSTASSAATTLDSPADDHDGDRTPFPSSVLPNIPDHSDWQWPTKGIRREHVSAPALLQPVHENLHSPVRDTSIEGQMTERERISPNPRMTILHPSPMVTYHAVTQPSLVSAPVYPTLILNQCQLSAAQAVTQPSSYACASIQPVSNGPGPLTTYGLVPYSQVPGTDVNSRTRVPADSTEDDGQLESYRTNSSSDSSLPLDQDVPRTPTTAVELATESVVSCGLSSTSSDDYRTEHIEDENILSDPEEEECLDAANSNGFVSARKRDILRCQWRVPGGDPLMLCNEPFSEMSELVDHITQHVNAIADRQFVCLWHGCERRGVPFKAKYKLVNHVRVHTNEKPFVCKAENCGRLFARSENLRIHMRVHSGEKPFKCPHPGCGKSFANSSDRKKHTFVHSQERPYACKEKGCGKRYTHPSSLRKHALLHKSPGAQTFHRQR